MSVGPQVEHRSTLLQPLSFAIHLPLFLRLPPRTKRVDLLLQHMLKRAFHFPIAELMPKEGL